MLWFYLTSAKPNLRPKPLSDTFQKKEMSQDRYGAPPKLSKTLYCVTIHTWTLCNMMPCFSQKPRHRAHECSLCFTSICIHGLDLMAHSCSHIEHLLINVLPNGHCSSRLQQITQCAPLGVHKNVSSNWLYK